jgi:hypothetical protein
MGFLFKKKQTQTQTSSGTTDNTSNINSTTNRTAPDWITSPVQGFIGDVGGLNDPSALTAGPTDLEKQGWDAAAHNLSGSPWNYDAGADLTRSVAGADAPTVQGATAEGYIKNYYDPYEQQVVNATDADLSANEGNVRAKQALDLAGSGAFGGSGAALTQSMTEGELARARASTLGNIRSQGFSQALGAAQQDASREQAAREATAGFAAGQLDRRLGAGAQLGALSSQYSADQRANAGTMADLGERQRQIQIENQMSPIDLLKTRIALFSGLPLDMFGGQATNGVTNTTGTTRGTATGTGATGGSPADAIGTALQIAALFSDERLKTGIVKLYDRPDGLGVYLYRYLWSPIRFIGVMAQEVLKVKPEAVSQHPSGFLMVDYSRL